MAVRARKMIDFIVEAVLNVTGDQKVELDGKWLCCL